ncbi:flagellar hook-associated protein FlgL [Kineococcus glutinatus]|uniref:Flagellar hook-associated protein FlgL n=1 Tax=Kineococcus glutinatus TaxID=1070872 RepID=A0ABP9HX28_9ACTN
MLSRISTRTTAMTSLANLQTNQSRNQRLQEQITSGKSIAKGSDNPVAAGEALRTRAEIAATEQHLRNNADGRTWLTVQEGALDGALDGLQTARSRAVQAASTGTLDASARKGIAAELRAIRDNLLGAANTEHLGRPVFAGAKAGVSEAYSATGAYQGDGNAISRTVAPGVDVQVNVPGSTAFGSGTTASANTFVALDELIAAVDAGDAGAITAGIGTIDAGLDRVKGALATIGARSNQLTALQDTTEARAVHLSATLEDVEGVDMAKAMVEFSLQNTSYQAALAATAKVIQPTLLDFLA